jgi:hypothetical protein
MSEMANGIAYEYTNEESIDREFICTICTSPFNDPWCTPCDHTFCRACIKSWIDARNVSCPICRKNVSVNLLTQANRTVRNILDRIPVKCTKCGQRKIQRGQFENHISKMCPMILDTNNCESFPLFMRQIILENSKMKEQMKQLEEDFKVKHLKKL